MNNWLIFETEDERYAIEQTGVKIQFSKINGEINILRSFEQEEELFEDIQNLRAATITMAVKWLNSEEII